MVVGPAGWGTCTRTISCSSSISLAYWNNTIATCPRPYHDIVIFDVLTGSQTAIFSGHSAKVKSFAFSSDGTLLVSGNNDKTIELWDVQTGGIIKTFCGHTGAVNSVSISPDNTTLASGSEDNTICLWNVETGGCHAIMKHQRSPITVTFSPTNSQLLLSSSNGVIQQWGIDGHKIGPPIAGTHVTFSPDGTQFVSYKGETVTIRDTNSRVTVVEINQVKYANHCCFSPDGRLIAAAADHTIYLWDITGHNPCLIQTLSGHVNTISSLVFSSSITLVSASDEKLIKFWQIGAASVNPIVPNSGPTSLALAPIIAVSLQAKNSLAFSMNSEGVVKTWDILTGCYEESCKIQAEDIVYVDMQLTGGRLIIVWYNVSKDGIHIWDAEKGALQIIDIPDYIVDLRITGDGTRVLQMDQDFIQAWSIWTGEPAGKEKLKPDPTKRFGPLQMDGSKVLIQSGWLPTQGWDFGTPGSTPIQFSETSDIPPLNFIVKSPVDGSPARIEDSVTGREVFQLSGRYANPCAARWDGQYLIAGYMSGEVLILDFSHVLA